MQWQLNGEIVLNLKGYTIDDVDSLSRDLIQLICEVGATNDLGILALCRSIVMIGNDDDLDSACRVIDEFTEIPFDALRIDE